MTTPAKDLTFEPGDVAALSLEPAGVVADQASEPIVLAQELWECTLARAARARHALELFDGISERSLSETSGRVKHLHALIYRFKDDPTSRRDLAPYQAELRDAQLADVERVRERLERRAPYEAALERAVRDALQAHEGLEQLLRRAQPRVGFRARIAHFFRRLGGAAGDANGLYGKASWS